MKRLIVGMFAAVLSLGIAAAPATATGGGHNDPPAENKKVTLCHATSSETNPYNKIEVSVAAFYNAGHIDHEDDIWEAFSYTTKGGDVVNVPAQGDTSLLAFEDCEKPKVDEEVPVPDYTFNDPCGTEDDTMAVADGEGYSVGDVVKNGPTWSITVTADDGFVFENGEKTVKFTHTFTDVDCDLPETGGKETFLAGGIGALALFVAAGVMLVRTRNGRQSA